MLKKLHEENLATIEKKLKYKGITFVLCLFLGLFGAHKFYEEKMGMGFLYFFTGGLFGIGWMADIIIILFKPNTYYV
ncbi:MAG: TM2 domain-containing protein [Agathobacter sp.]|nr:TM2 domain-containing protein [Agathobacter sp.]